MTLGGCNDDTASAANPGFGLQFEEIVLDGQVTLITDFVFIPGKEELLVADKNGTLIHFRLEGNSATQLGTVQLPDVFTELDCGLLSIALDPEFDSQPFIYAGLCTSLTHSAIYRYRFDPNNYAAIAASGAEIITVGDDRATRPWHNVGSIGFEDNGVMWAVFGDKTLPDNAPNTSNNLGALLRFVPNREGTGLTPATDNPFVSDPTQSPLIFAWGLRSPWKSSRDSRGRYWIGDVGATEWEEVNLIDAPGQNFGWPFAEGRCIENCTGLRDPLLQWGRGDHLYLQEDAKAEDTLARVVWVGPIYTPPQENLDRYRGQLTDRTLFGEYCVGFIRMAAVDDNTAAVVVDTHIGHLPLAASWRQGPNGYLYTATVGRCQTDADNATDMASGKLYRVVERL